MQQGAIQFASQICQPTLGQAPSRRHQNGPWGQRQAYSRALNGASVCLGELREASDIYIYN